MSYPYLLPNGGGKDQLPNRWSVHEFCLDLPGHPSRLRIAASDGPVPVSHLVTMAKELSDRATRNALDRLGMDGHRLLCRHGCNACCHYLLPVSIPEIHQFQREFRELDTPAKYERMRNFQSAAERIIASPPGSSSGIEGPNSLSRWYSQLELPCPMLHERNCADYDGRPLACREYTYILTGLAEPTAARLLLPLSYAEMMGQLHAELAGQDEPEFVLFPLAFAWLDGNLRAVDPVLPGPQLLRHFVRHLRRAGGVGPSSDKSSLAG